MKHGIFIKEGPDSWQILQQKNGFACINLSGEYLTKDNASKCEVFARVVLEETGENITKWEKCKITEGNSVQGSWRVALQQIPAGGLYRVETCLTKDGEDLEWSSRGDMIHHLGVGDIYVIAGQSNAVGYGKDPINDSPEIGVHVLKNNGKWDLASHPLNESTNSVHEENLENINPGNSPYLKFAKYLKRYLNYPIGLIQTALGGSLLSSWNPDENGYLYKNMIDIIRKQGGGICGLLWYQGCSDASMETLSCTYLSRFKCFVESVRKDMNNISLPIYTIQLNRSLAPGNAQLDRNWGMLREAQRQAANQIPYVYVIPANDCTLSDEIHISSASNIMLGERLARVVLNEKYGKKNFCHAPNIKKAYLNEKNKLVLEFENIYQKLCLYNLDVNEIPFAIEDETGKVPIKDYLIKKNNLIYLTMTRSPKGRIFVHGAYEKNPKFFLPMDFATHISMLSFYNVEVKRDKDIND